MKDIIVNLQKCRIIWKYYLDIISYLILLFYVFICFVRFSASVSWNLVGIASKKDLLKAETFFDL